MSSGSVNDLNMIAYIHVCYGKERMKIKDASYPDEAEVISLLMRLHCEPSVVCAVVVDKV